MPGNNLHIANNGNSEQQTLSPTAQLAMTAVTSVFGGGPGRGHQRLDETTPERPQGLGCLLTLLFSLGLTSLYSSHLQQIIGHHALSLGSLRFCRFPEIHTRPQ